MPGNRPLPGVLAPSMSVNFTSADFLKSTEDTAPPSKLLYDHCDDLLSSVETSEQASPCSLRHGRFWQRIRHNLSTQPKRKSLLVRWLARTFFSRIESLADTCISASFP